MKAPSPPPGVGARETLPRTGNPTDRSNTKWRNNMCNLVLDSRLILGAIALAAVSSIPLTFADAHEAHGAKCSETAMNAMDADIQSMPDGEAKSKAMKEFEMAKGMMDKEDMDACEEHMHSAMEAIEE
jgi:hypothetical protein